MLNGKLCDLHLFCSDINIMNMKTKKRREKNFFFFFSIRFIKTFQIVVEITEIFLKKI